MFVFQTTPSNFSIKPTFLGPLIKWLTTGFIMESDSERVGENFYFQNWFFFTLLFTCIKSKST